MTRDEAFAILDMEREQAVEVILTLAKKAEAYDKEHPEVMPTTPSGMIPVYLKPVRGRRGKPPGRKEGHPGVSRKVPQRIDHHQEFFFVTSHIILTSDFHNRLMFCNNV